MPRALSRQNSPKRRRAQEIIRQVEVRMIEQIKRLRPELQVESFFQTRRLHQRSIHILESRSFQYVSPGVSKSPESRKRKRRGVEPLIDRAMRRLRVADDVWTIVGAKAKRRTAGVAVVDLRQQRNSERPAALKSHDAKALPATQYRWYPSVVLKPRSPFAKRQVVAVAQREPVLHVEVRTPALGGSVEAVLWKVRVARARKEARRIVERLRAGVRPEQREPEIHSLLKSYLEAVVDRIRA